jgi:hypothetical protein
MLHIDTNGKEAQLRAWKARKRCMRRIAGSARRRSESERAAADFLRGMESPPLQGGTPHW